MLKRHSQFLQSLLFLFDLALISACWMAAYYIRFVAGWGPGDKGAPPLEIYIYLLVPILFVWGVSFRAFNLYRPRRMGSHLAEVFDIAVANSLSVLILVGLTFFVRHFEYSRLVFLYFWVLNLVALCFSRMIFREGLRFFRKHGYNQRHCLIIGAGKLGQRIAHSLSLHPEFGVKVRGYLSRHPHKLGQTFEGASVIGLYGDLEKYAPALDIVFLCLPPEAEPQAEKMLGYLATTTVEVKVTPSIYEFITLRAEAEMFEGLPVITLQGSPLYGWNLILKRSSDLIASLIALLLTLPVQGFVNLTPPVTTLHVAVDEPQRLAASLQPRLSAGEPA
jgi:FlaA1/EpsC-like NDP-sugar epimerase